MNFLQRLLYHHKMNSRYKDIDLTLTIENFVYNRIFFNLILKVVENAQ